MRRLSEKENIHFVGSRGSIGLTLHIWPAQFQAKTHSNQLVFQAGRFGDRPADFGHHLTQLSAQDCASQFCMSQHILGKMMSNELIHILVKLENLIIYFREMGRVWYGETRIKYNWPVFLCVAPS